MIGFTVQEDVMAAQEAWIRKIKVGAGGPDGSLLQSLGERGYKPW